jgi:hypothetical protein
MVEGDGLAELLELFGGALDQEEDFRGGFQFVLPPVMGFDAGDEVDASGEMLLQDDVGDAACFQDGGSGDEDEARGEGHGRRITGRGAVAKSFHQALSIRVTPEDLPTGKEALVMGQGKRTIFVICKVRQ